MNDGKLIWEAYNKNKNLLDLPEETAYNNNTRKKSLVGRVRKTPVGHGVDAVTNDEKRSRHPAIYGRTRVLLGKNDLAPTRDFLL